MQRHKNALKQVHKAVDRWRRRARSVLRASLIAGLAAGVPLAGGTQAQSAENSQGVGEWQVSFKIVNQNTSATKHSCEGDDDTYTLRGSLVGPSGVRSGHVDAVTLYVPGSGDGSTWHFTAAPHVEPSVDYVTEMARLGHASVFLHPLGYGPSDPVHGEAVCFGTYADMTQQVIGQLRDGSYSINGSAPKFERVALAGHSGGGFIAELTQVSFKAADALIVAGWTDYGVWGGVADDGDPLLPVPYGAVVRKERQCATAPESKPKWGENGPSGWAYMFNEAEMDVLFGNMHPDVRDAFGQLYERDPCGGDDLSQALAANIALAPTVDVPVLVGSGEHDPIAPPAAVKLQHARYDGPKADVTSFVIKGAAHEIMFEDSTSHPKGWGEEFRAILHSWLEDKGF